MPAGDLRGPYHMRLGIEDGQLVLNLQDKDSQLHRIDLALAPFRRIVKDYFIVCESYYDAIKKASRAKIEAIDSGRRGLHDEAADLLLDRLRGSVELDRNTARRLFTLLCVLHIRS